MEAAEDAVRSCFDGAFGDAGKTVLIEECLTGPECSLLAFVSERQVPTAWRTAQDHKRAFDGDRGPNTGGMGVYSPVPIVTSDELDAMHAHHGDGPRPPRPANRSTTITAACCTAASCSRPQGPKIVEFNARFGDPETQVVLPRLESDLVDVMEAVAEGRADDIDLRLERARGPCAWCWRAKAIQVPMRRAKSSWASKRPRIWKA